MFTIASRAVRDAVAVVPHGTPRVRAHERLRRRLERAPLSTTDDGYQPRRGARGRMHVRRAAAARAVGHASAGGHDAGAGTDGDRHDPTPDRGEAGAEADRVELLRGREERRRRARAARGLHRDRALSPGGPDRGRRVRCGERRDRRPGVVRAARGRSPRRHALLRARDERKERSDAQRSSTPRPEPRGDHPGLSASDRSDHHGHRRGRGTRRRRRGRERDQRARRERHRDREERQDVGPTSKGRPSTAASRQRRR